MAKTFKARYHNGVIEPLESLSLEEGKEITVTVIELPSFANTGEDPILKTAGAWKGLVDCEKLKRNIRTGRRVVQLGGLWKDIPFDVSQEDIRQVRRKLSKSLQRHAKRV